MSQTLYIQGYQAPVGTDLFDICQVLTAKLQKKYAISHEQITPDGDPFTSLGTINYYGPKGWIIPKEEIKAELENLGLDVKKEIRKETSQAFGYPVMRFEITHNPAANIKKAPELNVSENNVHIIHQLLGEQENEAWHVDQVIGKLNAIGSGQIAALTSPTTEETRENGLRIINCGNSFARINRYTEQIENIAHWAKAHGFTHLYLT